ncbi:MAG: hypothetical protein Q7T31_15005 [Dietzia sp.]|uniref:hypothetical protein n=1 Tax=Dietzia TaxID=37914 RepID=UPI0015CC50B1|nr:MULTISPECIES: hypothetical protein [Dietzia]MBB1035846.1 hypothetical protein [Dietzia sp. CQ4]MBB1042869.1 hypothetical protein [Dietzia sp. Cai40]MBB1045248.1 hypothetical protein [Dietzia sp. DQ11-44]MBB1051667.1 hypothetical protein [Dietzia sp. CW19]MBC7296584.1 hypothetical protein [Dietzia sp.]
MNGQLMLEDGDRSRSTPAPPAEVAPVGREATPAAVFPAPLTTVSAAATGGLIGLGAVYGVAARLADTLVGVAVLVLVFALTMAGPRVHSVARSEVGRTIAVILEAIAFGGVLGAVIVLF